MGLAIDNCIKALHLIEFVEEGDGITMWHCVPCDVDYPEYQDCCAGR